MRNPESMTGEGSPTEETPGGQPEASQTVGVISPVQGPNQVQSSASVVPSQVIHQVSDLKAHVILCLGAIQLVLGILEIVFNIGASVMQVDYIWFAGPGYWCGLPVILAGTFGIVAGMTKRKPMVIAFLVGSGIASVYTVGLLAVTGMGLVWTTQNPYGNLNSYYSVKSSIAWSAVLIIAGVAELVFSIISATESYNTLCGTSQANDSSATNLAEYSSHRTNGIFTAIGATQLALGILLVVFNIVLVHGAAFSNLDETVWNIGPGCWSGLLTIVTGFFGMAAGMTKRKYIAITFLVLSITTIVYTVGLLVVSAMGLDKAIADRDASSSKRFNFMVSWNIILLVVGSIELIISIISAIICCCGAVCRTSPTTMMPLSQMNLAIPSAQITNVVTNIKARVFVAMGSTLIALGSMEIAFNVGANVNRIGSTSLFESLSGDSTDPNESSSFLATGYWCGPLVILAGSFGIAAGSTKKKSMVMTFMALAGLGSVYALGILAAAGLGICETYQYDYQNRNGRRASLDNRPARHLMPYVWNFLLLIAGFIQLIISVASAFICGGSLIDKPQSVVTRPQPNGLLHTNILYEPQPNGWGSYTNM